MAAVTSSQDQIIRHGYDLSAWHHLNSPYRHRIGNRREFEKTRAAALFFVEIFAGNIIFGHLVSSNFLLISVPGLFDARHYVCLEGASFFDQLVDTLRIRTFEGGQSLQIPCLAA